MWIQHEKFGDSHDRYLLSIGRALLLCQSFEDICKRTLIWWNAAKRLSEGEEIDIEWVAQHPEHFMERFLGIALRKLVNTYKINDQDARTLADAKDARNYIAHKSAYPCLLPERAREVIDGEWAMLQANVLALANGHNLLCCWAYEFQEREPRPFTLTRIYPRQIAQWVMSPIREGLDSAQP